MKFATCAIHSLMLNHFLLMIRIVLLLLFSFVLSFTLVSAQDQTATEGSIYGGSLNSNVQPAASANMPYRWDIEVAGINAFWNNNIISTSPMQWERIGDSLDLNSQFITGDSKRWLTFQADVHILNFLFRWPNRDDIVVGAGWNIRSQTSADNMDYYYDDSIKIMSSFLQANALNRVQTGRLLDQQWSEWYITGSKIISQDSRSRFSVGGTVKLMKGMSAFVADVDGVSVGLEKTSSGTDNAVFNYAEGRYGYSENLEEFSGKETNSDAAGILFSGNSLSPSLSAGVSYTVRKPMQIAGFTNDDPAGYDWKLEASITDIGRLKYTLGSQSIIVNGIKGQPAVQRFAHLFDSVSTLNRFNDSLALIANTAFWQGKFSVSLPTALRINIDKNVGSHIYLNARLVLDMSFLNPGVDYQMHQMSYLMFTPRWEIKRVGFYTPIYLNTHGSFMAGAALRLGPLVAGVHDFRWFFENSRSGGAYLALVIRGLFKERSYCPTF